MLAEQINLIQAQISDSTTRFPSPWCARRFFLTSLMIAIPVYRNFGSGRNPTARINALERSSERGKLVERPNQVAIPSADHRILHPSLNFFLIT
jgi:hypothetical protein